MTQIISELSGPRWASQIVVLLDNETRVLSVNRSLAGNKFDSISEFAPRRIHGQLHPACDGKCRFNEMWGKAWSSLKHRDSIEWELDDTKMSRLFRLNLSKLPVPRNEDPFRQQSYKLLTITDITKYRHEYITLVEQQQALIRLLMAQGLNSDSSDGQPFDEDGDTGNRLMAGYLKTERSLSRQLVRAQEKERKRIASELHDGIAQIIGAVKFKIENSVAKIAHQYPDLDLSYLNGVVADIKDLADEVRRISNNLSPSMLENFGIRVAIEWLCEEFRAQNRDLTVDCDCRVDEDGTPDSIKVAVYRVAQEAFNNIAKHASATHVSVSLESVDGRVTFHIEDDGAGFDKQDVQRGYDGKAGLGLRSMQERVEATGGDFSVGSVPGDGVVICANWAAQYNQHA